MTFKKESLEKSISYLIKKNSDEKNIFAKKNYYIR